MKHIQRMSTQHKEALQKCHSLIFQCLTYENIHIRELICHNISLLMEYKEILSCEEYSLMMDFVNAVVKPIVYDMDYFSFLHENIPGYIDDDCHFIINSDAGLEEYLFKTYHHTLDLQKKLKNYFEKHFNINTKEI